MFSLIDPTDHSGELVPLIGELENVPLLFRGSLRMMLASYNKTNQYQETYSSFLRQVEAKNHLYGIEFGGYKITTTKEGRKKRLTGDFFVGFPISHLIFPTHGSDRENITDRKILSPYGRYVYRDFPPKEIDIELTKDKNIIYGYLGEANKTNLLALEYLTRNPDCIGYLDGVGRNTMLFTNVFCTHIEIPNRDRFYHFDSEWDIYPTLEALDIKAREENIR